MRNISRIMAVSAFALLISIPAIAQVTPEANTLPVAEPLDVGGTILQPGTYIIKSMAESRDRSVVQITSTDGQTVHATVLTVPHNMPAKESIPGTTFTYFPAGEGMPRALRTWYPSDPVRKYDAYDIVYEESRAKQLARLADAPVVTYSENVPATEFETTEIRRVTPQQTIEVYEAPAPRQTTGTTTIETTQVAETLPRTAGEVPMMALLGMLFLGAAIAFRAIR